MNILKKGKTNTTYFGECDKCGCHISCKENETKTLVDRDSPQGAAYVKCPECGNDYLWVTEK